MASGPEPDHVPPRRELLAERLDQRRAPRLGQPPVAGVEREHRRRPDGADAELLVLAHAESPEHRLERRLQGAVDHAPEHRVEPDPCTVGVATDPVARPEAPDVEEVGHEIRATSPRSGTPTRAVPSRGPGEAKPSTPRRPSTAAPSATSSKPSVRPTREETPT